MKWAPIGDTKIKRVGWKGGLSGKGQAILPGADKSAVQWPAFVTGVYKPVKP